VERKEQGAKTSGRTDVLISGVISMTSGKQASGKKAKSLDSWKGAERTQTRGKKINGHNASAPAQPHKKKGKE